MIYMLEVEDLKVYYRSIYGDVKSVDGVSFSVNENEIFGIAGESGCGKSTLIEGILRIIQPPGYIKSGKVTYMGKDLLSMEEEDLRRIRWSEISYIPQASMNSLNPVLKIEEQMIDVILAHTDLTKDEAKETSLKRLKEVGLPAEVMEMYPHELSGGMKQRVIISMSTLLNPKLLVADEPVTALDVVVQKNILQSIVNLKKTYRMTVIFVSHDMAAHAEIVDRLAIMYGGKIVEIGSVFNVFDEPLHPYTRLLISSVPSLEKDSVEGIPGIAPSPLDWPPGCRFHPRCPYITPICSKEIPALKEVESGRYVACHLFR